MCGCNAYMITYHCKNGCNKGRLFWRCPFWQIKETYNLFIWDDDMAQTNDIIESVAEEWRNDESKMREMQAVKTLNELYESSMKKNVKLHIQMKLDAFSGNLKSICFVLSFMVNVYLLVNCKC